MTRTTRRQRTTVAKVAVVVLAGFVVLVMLFPAGVLDSSPPQCLSTFGYRVPCGRLDVPAFRLAEWSLVAGAVSAAAVAFALRSHHQP